MVTYQVTLKGMITSMLCFYHYFHNTLMLPFCDLYVLLTIPPTKKGTLDIMTLTHTNLQVQTVLSWTLCHDFHMWHRCPRISNRMSGKPSQRFQNFWVPWLDKLGVIQNILSLQKHAFPQNHLVAGLQIISLKMYCRWVSHFFVCAVPLHSKSSKFQIC